MMASALWTRIRPSKRSAKPGVAVRRAGRCPTCREATAGETVLNMGVLTSVHGRPGAGMDWRVTIELSGADGTKQTHEVACGGGSAPHSSLDPLGLTLDNSKALLAGVQRHLVRGRVAEYSALRR